MKPTSNNHPLRQRHSLNEPRPRVFQRRTPAVLALQPELVFRRELRHIRWPLALGFIRAVLVFFEGGGGPVFLGGEAEGRGAVFGCGCCEGGCGCAGEGAGVVEMGCGLFLAGGRVSWFCPGVVWREIWVLGCCRTARSHVGCLVIWLLSVAGVDGQFSRATGAAAVKSCRIMEGVVL